MNTYLNHLIRLRDILQDRQADWTLKLLQLQQFQKYLMTGIWSHAFFLPNFVEVLHVLLDQTKGKQSQIVKVIWDIICYVTSVVRQGLEPCVEDIVQSLLVPLTQLSTETFAYSTIWQVLEQCKTKSVIPIIVGTLKSRKERFLLVGLKFLQLILKTYPANLIEPYAMEIQHQLKKITLPAAKDDRNATIYLLEKLFSSPEQRPDEEPQDLDLDLDLLFEKANSRSWSLRFSAFQELNGLEINWKEGWPLWQQIVPVHIQHIEDTHYKVAALCMQSLGHIIEAFNQRLQPSLVAILHAVLTVLSKADNRARKAAMQLVLTLQTAFETEVIIWELGGFLCQTKRPLFNGAVIEVIHMLIERAQFVSLQIADAIVDVLKTFPCVKIEGQVSSLITMIAQLRGEEFVYDLPSNLRSFIKPKATEEVEESITAELNDVQHSVQLLNQLKSKSLEENWDGLELAEILVAEDSYFEWGDIFPNFCTTLLKLTYREQPQLVEKAESIWRQLVRKEKVLIQKHAEYLLHHIVMKLQKHKGWALASTLIGITQNLEAEEALALVLDELQESKCLDLIDQVVELIYKVRDLQSNIPKLAQVLGMLTNMQSAVTNREMVKLLRAIQTKVGPGFQNFLAQYSKARIS